MALARPDWSSKRGWKEGRILGLRACLFLAFAAATALLAAAASAQAAQYVYVANSGSNDVSQYRVGTGGKLAPLSPATVAAGENPSAIAVSADVKSVYVVNSGEATISQYDIQADGKLSPKNPATVAAGVAPQDIAVAPNGTAAYVSDLGLGSPYAGVLLKFGIGTDGKLSGPGADPGGLDPQGVAVSPDGKSVYVANEHGPKAPYYGTVSQDDRFGGSATTQLPRDYPLAVTTTPNGKSAYVGTLDMGGGSLFQFDVGADGALSFKDPREVSGYGTYQSDVTVSPDGRSLYAAGAVERSSQPGNDLLQYDVGAGGKLSPKSPTFVAGSPDASASAVAVNPDGKSVYLASESGVSQFDVGAGGKLSAKSPVTLAAGDDPSGVAVTPTTVPGSVKVVGKTLVVTAAASARDNLVIAEEDAYSLRVTDLPGSGYSGSALYSEPGGGCYSTDTYTAVCSHFPAIRSIVVSSGDRGDKVVNSTGVPSSLYGEAGADSLVGGKRGDVLIGGPGADVMRGLNGNDLLKARDGTSDKLIACGDAPGDTADLDKLPKDPNSVVKGCETKTRH